MKDHIVVRDGQLIQCRNDIVSHYFIDYLNSFSYEENKIFGITLAELKIGRRGKEYVIERAFRSAKKSELLEKYNQLMISSCNYGKFVHACDRTYVNVENLEKVKKVCENDEAYYEIMFHDGQVILTSQISQSLRDSLNNKRAPKVQECNLDDQFEGYKGY